MIGALGSAGRVLAVGIGGGGDVVGALVVAELARLVGTPAIVGGLTWERLPIDPLPGPRRIDELHRARRLNEVTALAEAGVPLLLAVFGAGCDGELTPDEVRERVAEVAAAGGDLGRWGPGHDELARLEAAAAEVPTEASAMALRCARGETGLTTIRDGRRSVVLTPLGGLLVGLDPLVALRSAARCAALVRGAASLAEANAILRDHGIRTELDYEAQQPPP